MINLPPIIYVEYKNLSADTVVSEQQKDLIAEVFKKLEGQNKIFIEKNRQYLYSKNSFWKASKFYEIRCAACNQSFTNAHTIDHASVHVQKKTATPLLYSVSFFSSDHQGALFRWQVDYKEIYPIVIFSGDRVHVTYARPPGIAITGYGKSLKNAVIGDVLHIEVPNVFGSKNKTTAPFRVIEAKAIGPGEVEYVRR